MHSCISVNRYATLPLAMGSEPIWVANVRILRTAKDWTQGDLASKAGVMPNTLSAALNGKTSPNLSTLEKLIGPKALNVPLWRLFVDDRQAAILEQQAAADASVTREDDIAARVQQRLVSQYAEQVKAALDAELKGSPAPPQLVTPQKRRRTGR